MTTREPRVDDVVLSSRESELIKQIAERKGLSEEEVASSLVSSAIARRVKKKTGKSPAKVYAIPRRTA